MVTHYLKDGTKLHDITGHVVKEADAQSVYALMDKINEKGRKREDGRQRC